MQFLGTAPTIYKRRHTCVFTNCISKDLKELAQSFMFRIIMNQNAYTVYDLQFQRYTVCHVFSILQKSNKNIPSDKNTYISLQVQTSDHCSFNQSINQSINQLVTELSQSHCENKIQTIKFGYDQRKMFCQSIKSNTKNI